MAISMDFQALSLDSSESSQEETSNASSVLSSTKTDTGSRAASPSSMILTDPSKLPSPSIPGEDDIKQSAEAKRRPRLPLPVKPALPQAKITLQTVNSNLELTGIQKDTHKITIQPGNINLEPSKKQNDKPATATQHTKVGDLSQNTKAFLRSPEVLSLLNGKTFEDDNTRISTHRIIIPVLYAIHLGKFDIAAELINCAGVDVTALTVEATQTRDTDSKTREEILRLFGPDLDTNALALAISKLYLLRNLQANQERQRPTQDYRDHLNGEKMFRCNDTPCFSCLLCNPNCDKNTPRNPRTVYYKWDCCDEECKNCDGDAMGIMAVCCLPCTAAAMGLTLAGMIVTAVTECVCTEILCRPCCYCSDCSLNLPYLKYEASRKVEQCDANLAKLKSDEEACLNLIGALIQKCPAEKYPHLIKSNNNRNQFSDAAISDAPLAHLLLFGDSIPNSRLSPLSIIKIVSKQDVANHLRLNTEAAGKLIINNYFKLEIAAETIKTFEAFIAPKDSTTRTQRDLFLSQMNLFVSGMIRAQYLSSSTGSPNRPAESLDYRNHSLDHRNQGGIAKFPDSVLAIVFEYMGVFDPDPAQYTARVFITSTFLRSLANPYVLGSPTALEWERQFGEASPETRMVVSEANRLDPNWTKTTTVIRSVSDAEIKRGAETNLIDPSLMNRAAALSLVSSSSLRTRAPAPSSQTMGDDTGEMKTSDESQQIVRFSQSSSSLSSSLGASLDEGEPVRPPTAPIVDRMTDDTGGYSQADLLAMVGMRSLSAADSEEVHLALALSESEMAAKGHNQTPRALMLSQDAAAVSSASHASSHSSSSSTSIGRVSRPSTPTSMSTESSSSMPTIASDSSVMGANWLDRLTTKVRNS